MDVADKELLVSRIAAGTLRFRILSEENETINLCFKKPTLEHIYVAQELYHEYQQELKDMRCMTEEEVIDFMIQEGLWTVEEQKILDEVTKNIDDFKVKLCELSFKANEKKTVRKALKIAKEKFAELSEKKQSYAYLSVKGAASMLRARYIIGMSTFYRDGRPVYTEESFWDSDTFMFEQIADIYFKSRIPEHVFRILARTDPWRSIWNSRKAEGQVFGVPSTELSDEQRNIVVWSNIYDSIYEHSDCPPDDIIEDDDILDGWMIIQRRKRKESTEKNKAEELVSNEKIRGCSEVFVPVDTFDDAKKLNETMNDTHAQMVKKQRMAFARKQGTVSEEHMPDSMMEINQELNKQYMANAKGK